MAFLSEAFIDTLDGEVTEALCPRGRDGFTASDLCEALLVIRGRLPTVFLNIGHVVGDGGRWKERRDKVSGTRSGCILSTPGSVLSHRLSRDE